MIRMLPELDQKVQYLVGQSDRMICVRPLVPYDEPVCEFLNSLSVALLSDGDAKHYPDVISFAYWCRKANIAKLKHEFSEKYVRLGLGVVFHIAPSNVPINFAFSYAFSLLAGNANIVRVPTKDFPQTTIVCNVINQLFADPKYEQIAAMSAFVKYQQNDEVTGAFSAICNARIIWGGDQTINNIRRLAISERCIEVAFSDRYSFCVLDGDKVLQADNAKIDRLANAFYNDTYLMDQNACSSPHLVVWLGTGDVLTKAKQKFWDSVYKAVITKYEVQAVQAVDKYTQLCRNAIDVSDVVKCDRHGNYIYRMKLGDLPLDVDSLRGKSGYFYEYDTDDINHLAHLITGKYQTLTYFGLEKDQLLDFVLKNRLVGLDRIVPIGSALDISVIWDGYDLIRTLSRICDIR